MTKQLAKVVLSNSETNNGEVIYACSELNEAYKWSEENRDKLPPGGRYDIYYRYEEDE